MLDHRSSPSTVVFDLGGVLIDWNPRYLYRQLIADEATMEVFLTEICSPAWNLETDRGWVLAEATAHLVRQHPDKRHLIEAYFTRWIEMVAGPMRGTVDLLEELAARKVPLFALSNWSAETFPLVRQAAGYEFFNRFERLYISGELGLIKPDPAFFNHMLAESGREAGDCFFIDDNAANIAAAGELGFATHHFKESATLRQELEAHGLLA
jgi:2-haloacid dehalogenase